MPFGIIDPRLRNFAYTTTAIGGQRLAFSLLLDVVVVDVL
jgi:hypothetical protein